MRTLERNKQKIYYALYVSKTDVVDENGNYTGGQELTYGDIYDKMINVSPAKGTTEVEQFGLNSDYSKTLVTCDMSCPINEDSVLWIGIEPYVTENDETVIVPPNYKVTKVARSINSITYAVIEAKMSDD
jgi:hypothetical protein